MPHVYMRRMSDGLLSWTLIEHSDLGSGQQPDVNPEIQDAWLDGEPIDSDAATERLVSHGHRLDISGPV